MNLQQLNDQAKSLFDNKDYKTALHLLLSENLPVELLPNLAKCYYYTNQASKAIEIIEPIANTHDLKMDLALYHNAIGNFDKAFEIYSSLDDNDPRVKFNLGWHYIRKDQFRKGFEYMQYGSLCRSWGSEYYLKDKLKQRWNKEYCDHLLLLCEAGLGDNIIFLRWANHLKQYCKKLTILCNQSLVRLFNNSGYDAYPDTLLDKIHYDYYVPSMSIPNILGLDSPTQYVEFPYISSHVETYISKQFQQFSGLKIGIKWQGNKEFDGDLNRTLPKERLKELSKYGQLFSLQLDEDLEGVPNCGWMIRDWTDTYSILKNLDLVVTSCTSIVHLCGAIGVRCIVLTPIMNYFCWASDNQLWYPDNIKVIKQKEYGNWNKSFEELFNIMDRMA